MPPAFLDPKFVGRSLKNLGDHSWGFAVGKKDHDTTLAVDQRKSGKALFDEIRKEGFAKGWHGSVQQSNGELQFAIDGPSSGDAQKTIQEWLKHNGLSSIKASVASSSAPAKENDGNEREESEREGNDEGGGTKRDSEDDEGPDEQFCSAETIAKTVALARKGPVSFAFGVAGAAPDDRLALHRRIGADKLAQRVRAVFQLSRVIRGSLTVDGSLATFRTEKAPSGIDKRLRLALAACGLHLQAEVVLPDGVAPDAEPVDTGEPHEQPHQPQSRGPKLPDMVAELTALGPAIRDVAEHFPREVAALKERYGQVKAALELARDGDVGHLDTARNVLDGLKQAIARLHAGPPVPDETNVPEAPAPLFSIGSDKTISGDGKPQPTPTPGPVLGPELTKLLEKFKGLNPVLKSLVDRFPQHVGGLRGQYMQVQAMLKQANTADPELQARAIKASTEAMAVLQAMIEEMQRNPPSDGEADREDLIEGTLSGDGGSVEGSNPLGLTGKKRGSEYAGEHDNEWLRTAKYTEQERAQWTATVNENGELVDGNGNLVNTYQENLSGPRKEGVKLGYVVDPETGKMVTFKEARLRRTKDGAVVEDKFTGSLAEARNWVKKGWKVEIFHHSSALGGADVASAGMIQVDRGKLKRIDIDSGHYKPLVHHLLQTLELLAKQGALLDKTPTDSKGNTLQGSPRQLYDYLLIETTKLPARQAQLAKLNKELHDLADRAEEEDDKNKVPELTQELERITRQIDLHRGMVRDVQLGFRMLGKIGAGASNKIGDVTVGYYEGEISTNTLKSKTFRMKEMKANRFLKSGGGNTEQLENKTGLLGELGEKFKEDENLRQQKERMDEEATQRADDISATVVDIENSDFGNLLDRLKKRERGEAISKEDLTQWERESARKQAILRLEAHVADDRDGAAGLAADALLQKYPDDISIKATVARIYNRSGKKNEASKYYAQITFEDELSIINDLIADQDFERAHEVANDMLERYPTSVKLAKRIGKIYKEEGDLSSQLAHFRKVRDQITAKQGDYPENAGQNIDDRIFDAMDSRVADLIDDDESDAKGLDEAESLAREMTERSPKSWWGFDHLGSIFTKRGDEAKAAESYLQALQVIGNDPSSVKKSTWDRIAGLAEENGAKDRIPKEPDAFEPDDDD